MAKKPSAAELKQQGTELATQFAEMRKAQHNFALLISKDGLILKTHRRHPGETLWRKAKKEGGSNKGAKGICTMSGKVIEFQCDDLGSVPSTLAKLFKAYCADRGQPARGNFVEMTGQPEVDEEDGAENEEGTTEATADASSTGENDAESENTAGGGGGETETTTSDSDNSEEAGRGGDDLKTGLQREYEELLPTIEAAAESANKGFAKKVGGLRTMFETQIEGNTKKARAIIGLLQTTIQTGIDAGDVIAGGPGNADNTGENQASGDDTPPDTSPSENSEGPDPAILAERRNRIAELERGVDELLAQFAAG